MRSILIAISLAFWLFAFQAYSVRADEPNNQNSPQQSTYNQGNAGNQQQPKTSHNRTKATHKTKKYSHSHYRHHYHNYAYGDYDRPYYYRDYYPYYGYDPYYPYYYYGPGLSINTPFFGINIP